MTTNLANQEIGFSLTYNNVIYYIDVLPVGFSKLYFHDIHIPNEDNSSSLTIITGQMTLIMYFIKILCSLITLYCHIGPVKQIFLA